MDHAPAISQLLTRVNIGQRVMHLFRVDQRRAKLLVVLVGIPKTLGGKRVRAITPVEEDTMRMRHSSLVRISNEFPSSGETRMLSEICHSMEERCH